MNCPKCKENNPNNAYYCHKCGKKLRNRINAWLICSICCAFSAIGLGILAYNNYDYAECYRAKYCNAVSEIEELNRHLPQTYYTKYPNQPYYHICGGSFEESTCQKTEKGSAVIIYTFGRDESSDVVYGLTHAGWIPMDRLTSELQ